MNYSITTSSYFDVAAKKLAKKYPYKSDDSKMKLYHLIYTTNTGEGCSCCNFCNNY